METLLIALVVMSGLVLVLLALLLLRRPPDLTGPLAVIGERL